MSSTDVVVTGYGATTPLGGDAASTWDALLAGQSTGFDTALGAFLADCERTRCDFRRAVDGDLFAAYDALAARVEQEPLPAEHPLWDAPNVLITPHVAGEGPYLDERRLAILVENARRFAQGAELQDVVDKGLWF